MAQFTFENIPGILNAGFHMNTYSLKPRVSVKETGCGVWDMPHGRTADDYGIANVLVFQNKKFLFSIVKIRKFVNVIIFIVICIYETKLN